MNEDRSDIRKQQLRAGVRKSLKTQEEFFSGNEDVLARAFDAVTESLRNGGKMLIIGNGGSAADAQHVAAELVNRFQRDRPPLPAIALTTDTSILTAIGNDSDYRYVFSRQIEAVGSPGDILVAISTSGNSLNVVEGIRQARKMGIPTLALTGGTGGEIKKIAAHPVCVSNTSETPRIQETLLLIEHLLCEWIEEELFPET